MTQSEWMRVCAEISRLWPHKPMPTGAAESWFPYLAGIDAVTVRAAVGAHATSSSWPPSLAELLTATQPPARGWEDALGGLRRLVSNCGGIYGAPPTVDDHGDPALQEVIDAYGWRAICNLEAGDSTVRAQFRDAYKAAQARQREQTLRDLASVAIEGPRRDALTGGGR